MRVLLLAVLFACAATPALAEDNAEAAFRAARDWTVLVETAVPVPFVEDEQGSYQGAGIVVDARRGWVLTNAHVASHSPSTVRISFANGASAPAQRLYVDPYADLAVVAYDPHAVPAPAKLPKLECGVIPEVGHPVGAYGHPWGFRFTGTRGIASGVTARFGPDMLQTDAPINEGNSGGPLISLKTGGVVGINASKIAEKAVEGLSFAVPISQACTILSLLQAGIDPSPPVMHVDFEVGADDDPTLVVARNRLPEGMLDLRPGDRILSAEGQPVGSQSGLVDALRGHLDKVLLDVRRDGHDVVLRGRLPKAALVTQRQGLAIDGAVFAPVNDFDGGWLTEGPGLMVHYVEAASQAESQGLDLFDIVYRVDGRPVHSLADLEAAVSRARSAHRGMEFLVLRTLEKGMQLMQYRRVYLGARDVVQVGGR